MKNYVIKRVGIAGSFLLLAGLLFYLTATPVDNAEDTIRERMKKSAPGPDARPSGWAWQRRIFPHNQYDRQAYRNAVKDASRLKSRAVARSLEAVTFAGPSNIGGRISDIEFNPQNGDIVYAGAATGGVFKSTDKGVTWAPVFDDAANLNIGDIAINPLNPDVVYVGTGEGNGGHNNFPGEGVYKSTDAGNSWELIGLENTVSIGRVVVDPVIPQRVFVAAQGSYYLPNPDRGVYRSSNGGTDWERVLFVTDSTGACDIAIDPINPNRIMATTWERARRPHTGLTHLNGPTSGIYRSTDGGDNWERLGSTTGLPIGNQIGRIGLAVYPNNPDSVYALVTTGGGYRGLYLTTNFGDSWTDVDPDNEIADGTAGFSWYFGQVRVHPANPDIVYAMDVAFMRSTNGGTTWPIIYGYNGSPANLHVDHHALAFHPDDPDYIINGNDGGLNISEDAGVSFTKVVDLPVNQFYEIGLDFNNPERIYGGTQDNGTLRTLTGATDDWNRIFGGDGFYVIVDHTNPNVIYAESQFGNLGKSTDGGFDFNSVLNGINDNEPTNWSTPVIMDPSNNNVLYYGTNRLYRTTNGAASWSAISPDLTTAPGNSRLGTITTIDVSPLDSDILWVGTDDSHVWVTTDGGNNWTDVSATLPFRWVTRVVADPQDPNIAYVTFNGLRWVDPEPRVYRTVDLGAKWENISSNLPDAPVNAFAVNPADNEQLFVGSDLGAYFSVDNGANWEYISSDFPMVSVYDMKIHPIGNYLALGTHARSIYRFNLEQLVTGIADDPNQAIPAGFELAQNFPNPFNPNTTIAYKIDANSQVNLTVYDILGKRVKTLVDIRQASGQYQLNWDGTNHLGESVPSGTYFYRLTVSGKSSFQLNRKMQLVR